MSASREICGRVCQIGKLSALEQFHVLRRLAPVLHSSLFFAGATAQSVEAFKAGDVEKSNQAFVEAAFSAKPLLIDLARLDDQELDYVFHAVLKHVKIKQGANFTPISVDGQILFDDLTLIELVTITETVLVDFIRPMLTASTLTAILGAVNKTMNSPEAG